MATQLTAQDVQNLLAAIQTLNNTQTAQNATVQNLLNQPNTGRSVIARPEPFKSGSNDARRFIHFFTVWARAQGPPLNTTNAAGTQADHAQWILHALSLLQGEAAVWAVPYLQSIEQNTTSAAAAAAAQAAGQPVPAIVPFPFGQDWSTFLSVFKARFQAGDDQAHAQRELDTITQGNRSVADYAARFQEVSGRTGFSDTDLMTRFRRGLKQEARHWVALATLSRVPTTLDELVTQAIHLL